MHVALLNRICDSLMTAGSKLRLKARSAFFVMGLIGLFMAISVGSNLAAVGGLSKSLFAALCIVSLAAFLSSALLIKIIIGEERLTLYQHKIVVMVFTCAFLKLLHQPVLPYLDVILIAVGIFVVFGRFGCLWVGCCHGRPHQWGIRYTDVQAAMGLDPIYVGLRVIPVQLIEAAWMSLIVIVGIALILNHATPGAAVTLCLIGYGFGRFWFEFLRADAERGYFSGFSEAQWTSLVLMSIVVLLEFAGKLPFHFGPLAATALVGVSMIAVSVRARYQNTTQRLSEQPGHVAEIAEAIQLATSMALYRCDVCKQKDEAGLMHVAATSIGFQVSASRIRRPTSWTYHYAISYRHGSLTLRTLKLAAEIVRQARGASSSVDVIKGQQVMHLLVES